MRGLLGLAALVLVAAVALGGCGLNVDLGDLFLITRTGNGTVLTELVDDSGGVTCDGHKQQKMLSSSQLITARDLADDLGTDAQKGLHLPPVAGSVYYYRIRLQQGTISFPDRAATAHQYLGPMEQFVLQTAQQYCS